MPKKPQTDWEKAARALCSFDGNPENAIRDGKPLWMSYLDEAKTVLVAIGRFEGDEMTENETAQKIK
jgi:hypothetical protein